jgi:hypothetical protein
MTTFKWLVRLRIFANLTLAVFALGWPERFLVLLRFADPNSPQVAQQVLWAQAFGVAYIFLTLAYVPSAIAPARTPLNNILIAVAPIIPILLFFWLAWQMPWWWGGFLWVALYELGFALLLDLTLRREWIALLMTRP